MALQMEMMYYDSLNEAAREELSEDVRAQYELPEDANLVLATDLDPQIRSRIDELWTEVQLS
jgi:hypothetical protein